MSSLFASRQARQGPRDAVAVIVARVLVAPLLTHACGRAAHEEEEDEHATARHASGAGARARSPGPTSVVVCFLLRVLLRRAHSRGWCSRAPHDAHGKKGRLLRFGFACCEGIHTKAEAIDS